MRRRVAGFTMMEALVALAIASVSFAVLFDLLHQLVDGQRRNEQTLRRAELQRNALVLLRDVNPQTEPTGEVELPPNLHLRWSSEAVTDGQTMAGYSRGSSTYYVQLYRIDAEVADAQGRVVQAFSVERLGWELPTTTTTAVQ